MRFTLVCFIHGSNCVIAFLIALFVFGSDFVSRKYRLSP
jgi:hypothetical protein